MKILVAILFLACMFFAGFRFFAQEQKNQKQVTSTDQELINIMADYDALEKQTTELMMLCRIIYSDDSDMALRVELALRHSKEKMAGAFLVTTNNCFPDTFVKLKNARSAVEEHRTIIRFLQRQIIDAIKRRILISNSPFI